MADRRAPANIAAAGVLAGLHLARMAGWLLVAIALSFAFFGLMPQLDLRVSALFHDPEAGFSAIADPRVEALRHAIWTASKLMVVAALTGLAINAFRRRAVFDISSRIWGFVLSLYLLGPGLMVDIIVKPLWGRVRPANTTAFGGSLPYSPPTDLVDHCARNCSFVSGEVSGATALAVAIVVIVTSLRHRLPMALYRTALGLAPVLPMVAAAQRIATGRHFLSDTVFAILFTLGMALCAAAVFRLSRRLPADAATAAPAQQAVPPL